MSTFSDPEFEVPIFPIVEPIPYCSFCKKDPIQFYCTQEEKKYCTKCFNKHHPTKKIKTEHKTRSWESSKNHKLFCKKHELELDRFCLYHQKLICQKCIKKSCKTHIKGTLNLKEAAEGLTTLMPIFFKEIKYFNKKVKKHKKSIDGNLKEFLEETNKMKSKIINEKRQIISKIENLYTQFTDQINKYQESYKDKLESILMKDRFHLENINNSINQYNNYEKILERNNPIEIINSIVGIKRTYKTLYPYTHSIRNQILLKETKIKVKRKDSQMTVGHKIPIRIEFPIQFALIQQQNELNNRFLVEIQHSNKKMHHILKKFEFIEAKSKNSSLFFITTFKPQVHGTYNINLIKLDLEKKHQSKEFQVKKNSQKKSKKNNSDNKKSKIKFDSNYCYDKIYLSNKNRQLKNHPNFRYPSNIIFGDTIYSGGLHMIEFQTQNFRQKYQDINTLLTFGVMDSSKMKKTILEKKLLFKNNSIYCLQTEINIKGKKTYYKINSDLQYNQKNKIKKFSPAKGENFYIFLDFDNKKIEILIGKTLLIEFNQFKPETLSFFVSYPNYKDKPFIISFI
ncbi:hypothetical protein M0813_01734 [Anaeramoeba flamelloides]|uniref:B box-type domain-containing protein n=1 Tax=Anaeramoeba flamelloides TaxID=1746091 RepID=A0ABQ8YX55_9EUKA|nr:hypothetical protein M0813_01734 [Anaeramoeba flamelloides]